MPAIWRILTTLLNDSTVCQADLRARTGLSHPVVVQQVAQLRRSGLILFGRPQGGTTGRPRVPINFNWEFRRLLAVEVHPDGLTCQATNLSGRPIGEVITRPLPAWTRSAVDTALFDGIHDVLQQPGAPWAGLGVVLPATIAADRRTVLCWQDFAGDGADPLGDRLAEAFQLPAFLYHEADALARAEWAERPEPARTILAISLRQQTRAMMALIAQGNTDCVTAAPCGAIGCLPVDDGSTSLNSLLRATGDASRRAAMGRALAQVAAAMVTVLNPECLVLQGDLAWSDAETGMVRDAVSRRDFPGACAHFTCEFRPSQARESLLGAASALAGQLLDLRGGHLNAWALATV